jgi:hypothetical protein
MAITALADLIQREQFRELLQLESLRKSVFYNTGVIKPNSALKNMMDAGTGVDFAFDYFDSLADTASNVSDDSATAAVGNKISSKQDLAIALERNNGWGSKDITAMQSTTGDPMMAIINSVSDYWARQIDILALAVIKGVKAKNILTNAGDMVYDSAGTPALITINQILAAKQTMGDARSELKVMICHSAIITALQQAGVTASVFTPEGVYLYETLAGLALLESDNVESTAANTYVSYLMGMGALAFAETAPKVPSEIARSAADGNGGGSETFWNRKKMCIHPFGHKFVKTAIVGTTPTNAELEAAAQWLRVADRKRVKMAFLIAKSV